MQDLKITIIQTALHWENRNANLELFSQKIASIKERTDLIVLPEMFTTGFSMKPKLFADTMNGDTLKWMQEQASFKKCVVTGSFICEENGYYYNRLLWVRPDGSYEKYDKRHLFRMAGEDNHYTAGRQKLVLELKGWKICPLVCYDLRFPVWSRNLRTKSNDGNLTYEYDVLLYVANWPEVRNFPWKTLLLARAIENQSYVVGLNRVGEDGNGIYHSGDSAVIDAKGNILSKIKPHEDTVETINLNYESLETFRKSFPAILDADEFEVK